MMQNPKPQTRNLKSLLSDWATAVANTPHPQPPHYAGADVVLSKLTEKTSEVEPGACFVARVRAGSDGHPYIGQAIANGASMILAQRSPAEIGVTVPDGLVYLQVDDTALTLAWLAAAWYGFPSRQLLLIGVTGSDGKTSTANLLFAVLQAAGFKTGLLSTIKASIGDSDELLELHVTTPEAPIVQRYLRRMVDAGLTHCILETTSHALAQHRVGATDFDVAVVTNITHEHLDYHGSYEAYFAAKARLFAGLDIGAWGLETENNDKRDVVKTAVLNHDDRSFAGLQAISVPRQLTYGIENPSDVMALNPTYTASSTSFTLSPLAHVHPFTVSSKLVGEFNVYNMLAAATAATALNISSETIKRGLEMVDAIDGRMQRIDRGQDFLVIVDFAHTPFSLEKLLAAARQMGQGNGRIITLFGSAGKRDVAKRRMMAEISARHADLTVLTAEDPRTESLDDILGMMAAACQSEGGVEGQTFWRIADRGQAIYHALTLAQPDDLLLICGKGHEQSMCFGDIEYPWDDRTATIAALDAFLQGDPMPDLGLPTYSDHRIMGSSVL